MSKKKEYLTLEEAAGLLRLTVRSIYRYIKDGKIKATKVGHWRIQRKDLDEFIRQNSNTHKGK
ncbi:MAG: helix-turn-helix domain-containing protein [Patescibacteria group bacterium]|nr:helix-turn-helix domain-containing protein [Patescibacteria group bacterium]